MSATFREGNDQFSAHLQDCRDPDRREIVVIFRNSSKKYTFSASKFSKNGIK